MMMTIASWCDPLVGLLTPGNRRSVASSADLGGVPVREDEGWRGLRSSPSSSQRLYSPSPPWSPSPRLSSSPSPLIYCQGAPLSPLVIFAPSSDGTGKGNNAQKCSRGCENGVALMEVFGSYWSWSPFQSLDVPRGLDLGKKALVLQVVSLVLVTSCLTNSQPIYWKARIYEYETKYLASTLFFRWGARSARPCRSTAAAAAKSHQVTIINSNSIRISISIDQLGQRHT